MTRITKDTTIGEAIQYDARDLFQFLWAQECTVLDVRHQQVKH